MSNGKKECDITIESDSPEDPNWAVWKMSLFTIGELDATSLEDMVNKIEEKKREEDCCMKSLTIMGHGAPGYIEVGTDSINIWDTSWKPTLDRLKGNFCEGAGIALGGCSVGADQDGANLLALIANNLGVRVNAPTHSINQYWSGPGEQVAEPGQPAPDSIPDGGDTKPKMKKPKGKKSNLIFMHEGEPKTIDTSSLKAFAILKPNEMPIRKTLRQFYNDTNLFDEFVESLDIFDPISAVDMPFKVQAHLYLWLRGEGRATKTVLPVSYLVGGYRYLVLGGDWSHTYRLTGGMHEKIKQYGRYPSSAETLRKYPFLRARAPRARERARRSRKRTL